VEKKSLSAERKREENDCLCKIAPVDNILLMVKKREYVSKKKFAHILETGKTYHQSFFSFHVLLSQDKGDKIACVVPRKAERSVVVRNKLRRRSYHILYKLLQNSHKPFLGILFIKAGAKNLPHKVFKREIATLLKHAGIL